MNAVTLNFRADEQKLTTDGVYLYASNTVEYIKAVFDLGANWSGFDSVRAVWYNDFVTISKVLDSNGECTVPHEVLARHSDVYVNLVGSNTEDDELVDRLTTYPLKAIEIDANARVEGNETAPVTPSQFEQYIAIVEQIVGTVKDIDHTELTADYCLIIYYTDGTNSGKLGPIRGATGATGNGIASATLNPDYTLTLTYTNGQHDTVGPIRGAQGDTGNGIQSIYLTGTSGAVKTYTILFTDGNTTEFQVTDGEVTNAVFEQAFPTDTASGAIASFPDGSDLFYLKSCEVTLEPIQDLNGYDSPWVGGGGVNKVAPSGLTVNESSTTATYNDNKMTVYNEQTALAAWRFAYIDIPLTIASGESYTFSCNISQSISGCTPRVLIQLLDGSTNVGSGSKDGSGSVYATATASASANKARLVVYVNNATTVITDTTTPTIFEKIQLEKGSTPTSFKPYSNICPISGRSSVGVTDFACNLWNEECEQGGLSGSTGQTTTNNTRIRPTDYISIKGGKSYYYKAPTNTDIFWYDAHKAFLNRESAMQNSASIAPSNACYMKFQCGYSGYPLTPSTYNHDISINYPSADHDYHPYNGTTYTTPLGQTVYGGTVDCVSGVMTLKYKLWTPSSSNSIGFDTTHDGFYVYPPDGDMKSSRFGNGASSMFVRATENWSLPCSIGFGYNNAVVYFVNINSSQGISTIQDVKDWLDEKKPQVLYELATPIVVQLTPTQIQTLKGQNNIFSDGDINVTYKADTQLWVEKKLAE